MMPSVLAAAALLLVSSVEEGRVPSKDGVAIHYAVQGKGEPALVLIHGFGIDSTYWDAVAGPLSAGRRVVVLDLAGHGRSGSDREAWTVPAFGADVVAVADHLKLGRVILAGHSMGGQVMLEAARLLPGRVAGLVPVDTLLDPDFRLPEPDLVAALAALRKDYAETARGFAEQYMYAESTPAEVRQRTLADWLKMPPELAVAILEQAWRYDPRPAIADAKVPIVAVNADKYPTHVEAFRKYAPGFDALLVRGVGHYPMLEAPAELVTRLEEAMARVEAAAAHR